MQIEEVKRGNSFHQLFKGYVNKNSIKSSIFCQVLCSVVIFPPILRRMANKGAKEKQTELVPKNVNVPGIEISEEGASGGTEGNDGGKKGVLKALADKVKNIGQEKRARSTSPKTRKEEKPMEVKSSEGFKAVRSSTSPSKTGFKGKVKRLLHLTGDKGGDDQEMENLCEEEVTEHPKTHLAPPEKDMGIASPSTPTEPMAEKCESYDKSSSVSSAPSDYSSIPYDDTDTDVMSPDDGTFPEDGKKDQE